MKKRKLPECLLWDAEEVAAAIGVSVRCVKYWASANRLPGFVSLGRLARWRRSEIERWIAGGCKDVQFDTGHIDDKDDTDDNADSQRSM